MYAKIAITGLIAALLWAVLVGLGFYNGWFLSPIAPPEVLSAFSEAIEEKIDNSSTGNIGLIVLMDGKPVYEFYDSAGEEVSGNSVFQIASVSKWVTALGVLKLVEMGKLDLDAPVSTYLTRWKLPPSPFSHEEVTIRRLLSHTAGLSSFGYFGFLKSDDLQTLEESLLSASDVVPPGEVVTDNLGSVEIVREPGTKWDYTGAGYTILQLVVEEVSGQKFSVYMDQEVFSKNQMAHSTFDWQQAETLGLVSFYDELGNNAPHYVYTAEAAASLYTTTHDLTRLVQSYFPLNNDSSNTFSISQELLRLARAPQGSMYGVGVYGLGAFRYASNNQGDVIFGHDGSNYPAINTAVRINPTTQDAIIVFCTGDSGLATRLAGDWVLWNTGNADLVSLLRVYPAAIVRWILAGWIIIGVLVATGVIRHMKRRQNQ